jgi:hypothetical protein
MASDLIPPEKAKFILSLNAWAEGDVFPLGNGRLAEYNVNRHSLIITERGEVVGEVPFQALRNMRSK